MNTSPDVIRDQAMAQIIDRIRAPVAASCNPWAITRKNYFTTPGSVLSIAIGDAEKRRTEGWWHTIERTIDVEPSEVAIAGAGFRQGPAGRSSTLLNEAFKALFSVKGVIV